MSSFYNQPSDNPAGTYQLRFANELHAWRDTQARKAQQIKYDDFQTLMKQEFGWVLKIMRAIENRPAVEKTCPENFDAQKWSALQAKAESLIKNVLSDPSKKWESERAAWLVWNEIKAIYMHGLRKIDYGDGKGMVYPPEMKCSERVREVIKAIEGNHCIALQALKGNDLFELCGDPKAYSAAEVDTLPWSMGMGRG